MKKKSMTYVFSRFLGNFDQRMFLTELNFIGDVWVRSKHSQMLFANLSVQTHVIQSICFSHGPKMPYHVQILWKGEGSSKDSSMETFSSYVNPLMGWMGALPCRNVQLKSVLFFRLHVFYHGFPPIQGQEVHTIYNAIQCPLCFYGCSQGLTW